MPSTDLVPLLIRLRLVVGYLGEKPQLGWWQSSFLSPVAQSFAETMFRRSQLLARYHGLCEAARRKHDEHLGVGALYHLFLLPEAMEEAMHDAICSEIADSRPDTNEHLTAPAAAQLAALKDIPSAREALGDVCTWLSGVTAPQRLASAAPAVGPALVGSLADVGGAPAWHRVGALFQAAAAEGSAGPVFPYFGS